MFGLPNPYLILALLCALGGVYGYAHHQGYEQRVEEDRVEIERLNTEARAKEVELSKKIDIANSALRKAKDEVQFKQVSLNARADSGELRLPSTCSVQANPNAAPGSRDSAPESDIERQTVKDLIAIAADGDSAIIQLNSCIQQYNSVREIINKGVK